jgi:anaerobic selenocysteine-containing dehydrogenase
LKAGTRKPADAGRAGSLVEGWNAGLSGYTPAEVEKKTGVPAARIQRLAKEFEQQSPALAIVAGSAIAQTNGLFNALAVNALNALVGSVGAPGGIYFTPMNGSDSGTPFAKSGAMAVGPQTQVLLIDGANPVFASPKTWAVKNALMNIPYIVSFGNFIDETSVMSDLILPDHSFLESWVQSTPESGSKMAVSTFAPPVMQPLHETRSTPDVLLEVSRKLAKPLNLPWQKFEDMLKQTEAAPTTVQPANAPAAASVISYSEPQFDGDPTQYGFHFLPFPSTAFLDGSLAHLPLLQELPDPMTSAVWSSWVEINLQVAERLGIRQGDLLEITSSQGSIRVAAFPSPGIAPDVIAMPVGQGHENYTRYASGRGENPISILAPVYEKDTGSLAWAATRVKVAKVANADGRLVLIAGSLRDYPPEQPHR